jgi:hypothetical protein
MGVAPNVFLKPMEPAIQRIVDRVQAHQPLRVDAVVPPSVKQPSWKIPAPKPQPPREVTRVSEVVR